MALNLKLLSHASAASATGIEGVVWANPGDATLAGAEIGEFTGESYEAAIEGGNAVLLVPVASFGGGSLTTADRPIAAVQNTVFASGPVRCSVVDI